MFILQEMSNYETTRSDEFCEFDGDPKYNTKLFHKIKENIWLKNMQLIKFERRNTVYKQNFNFFQYLPLERKWAETGLIRKPSEGQSFFYNPNYPVNFPCG